MNCFIFNRSLYSFILYGAVLYFVACDDSSIENTNRDSPMNESTNEDLLRCTPGDVKPCSQQNCFGVLTCPLDGTWPGIEACEYPDEICDGFDQDCDGRIDETFENIGEVCSSNTDLCGINGVYACASTKEVACTVDVTTVNRNQETCNRIDDDCDGTIDEGFPIGDHCTAGNGACQQSGTFICNPTVGAGQAVICDATADESQSMLETCNDIDDDCDGFVDEDFTQIGQACEVGTGSCSQQGTYQCAGSEMGITCIADTGGNGTPELCNDIDDDCDGLVDEDFNAGDSCSVGIGICQGMGTIVCLADQMSAECNAVANEELSAIEVCNGQDDDCDGIVDETYTVTIDHRETAQAEVITMTYDDSLRLVTRQRSHQGNRNLNSTQTYIYAENSEQIIQVNYDGDTGIYQVLYTYDEEGVLSRLSYQIANVEIAYAEFTYNEQAQKLSTTYYNVMLGETVATINYTYDSNGQLIEEERDGSIPLSGQLDFKDDDVDALTSYQYESGRVMSHFTVYNHEMSQEAIYTYQDDVMIRIEINGGEDGRSVSQTRRDYQDGRLIYEAHDLDLDQQWDEIQTYIFNETGALTRIDWDLDGNLRVDYYKNFIYDQQRITFMEITEPRSEEVLERWYYIYNEQDQLIRIDKDFDVDTVIDIEVRYTYEGNALIQEEVYHIQDAQEIEVRVYQYNEQQQVSLVELSIREAMILQSQRWFYHYDDRGYIRKIDQAQNAVRIYTDLYQYNCE